MSNLPFCSSPYPNINDKPGTDYKGKDPSKPWDLGSMKYKNTPLCPDLGNNSLNLKNILSDDYKNIIKQQSRDKQYIQPSIFIDKSDIETHKNDGSISDYNHLVLKTNNQTNESWKHSPSDIPLVDDKYLYTAFGTQLPIRTVLSKLDHSTGPTLDGTYKTPRSLFMFSNNLASPACCPSTFTTDSGCICTTPNQRQFVKSGGIPLS